jgi:hypothetical protein
MSKFKTPSKASPRATVNEPAPTQTEVSGVRTIVRING